jgi:CO/xanthine dehydrogenase FAD-binding subunit
MTRRLVRPASFAQLRAELKCDPEAIVVGGAVGLMSAAMSPGWANTNIDLSGLPLNWATHRRVGAMASLALVQGAHGLGRQALAEAIAATATPALREMITIGGVLGARSARADVAVALAVHRARVRLLHVDSGTIDWLPVLQLWELTERFVILEVDLGSCGNSRYRRFGGHHRSAPAVVSVGAVVDDDSSVRVCIGAALPAPTLVDPDDLPRPVELLDDHLASRQYRHQIMCALVGELCAELGIGV